MIEYHFLRVHSVSFSSLSIQGFKLDEYGTTLNLTLKIVEVVRELLN